MVPKADILFLDARVVTVDPSDSIQEAVAVKGNKILAVGKACDLEGLKGPSTKVFDLGGATLMPGIVESHNHMSGYGMNRLGIDCKSTVRSIEDIKYEVRKVAAERPAGQWIRGWGYNQMKLAEGRHPNRWDLDQAAPDHPVLISRTCGHILAVNSAALRLAGVPDDIPDPVGGRFERIDGKISGVMFETACASVRLAAMFGVEDLKAGLRVTNNDYISLGITSSHDAGGAEGTIRAMLETSSDGSLKLRTYFSIRHLFTDSLAAHYLKAGLFTGFGNERLKVGPLKIMTDGSSSGPTAATRQPYTSMPEDSGILYFTQAELDELIEDGHAGGFQVTTHAVGDRAVDMTINSIEKALRKWPRKNHRHRIEHCGICPPDLIERIKNLGIVPVPQPIFFWEFGDGYLKNYGPERVRWMFPVRSFIDKGIISAGSSDCPVTTVNPWHNIYNSLTRHTQTGQTCGAEERITLMEALRLFTWNGAYASFEENTKGSIEPGKLADLTILDRDIFTTPVQEIKDIRPRLTMIDGEILHNTLE